MSHPIADEARAIAGTIESALGAEGREWLTRRQIASMLNCTIEEVGEPLSILLHYGRVESKPTADETLYRKTRVFGGDARRSLNIPIWNSWRHISRGSGQLVLGRAALDVYLNWRPPQRWMRKLRAARSEERVHPWGRGPGFHTFHLTWGPVVLIARRWRS